MNRHDDLVERAIRDAMARGEFDDLPGSGQPLELEDDDPAWWARRQVSEMRRRDAALHAARDAARRVDALWKLPDPSAVEKAVEAINREIGDMNARLPEHERVATVDSLEAVSTWHRMYRLRH